LYDSNTGREPRVARADLAFVFKLKFIKLHRDNVFEFCVNIIITLYIIQRQQRKSSKIHWMFYSNTIRIMCLINRFYLQNIIQLVWRVLRVYFFSLSLIMIYCSLRCYLNLLWIYYDTTQLTKHLWTLFFLQIWLTRWYCSFIQNNNVHLLVSIIKSKTIWYHTNINLSIILSTFITGATLEP